MKGRVLSKYSRDQLVQNERGNEHLGTTSELYLNRQDTNAGAYGCYILDMDETGNAIS